MFKDMMSKQKIESLTYEFFVICHEENTLWVSLLYILNRNLTYVRAIYFPASRQSPLDNIGKNAVATPKVKSFPYVWKVKNCG